MIEYITVLNSMAELVSCILNQFSDTWIFLSLDGFLGLDGKKLTDSGCSQFLSLESQVGGQYKLLSSGQEHNIQEDKNSRTLQVYGVSFHWEPSNSQDRTGFIPGTQILCD